MKSLILSSFLLYGIALKAQITQVRDITPFTQLEVSGAANVQFTQSDTLSLKVMAGESEMNNIYTTIENGVLTVRGKGAFKNTYKIYISGNTLKQITSSGASKVTIVNKLQTDSLVIDASGASNVMATIKTTATNVTVSGASVVNFEGSTETLYGTVNGASSLKAYNLSSVSTSITVSGASTAKVCASQKINANATGSSSVKFKGEPNDVSAEASSSSSIAKVVGDDMYKKSGNDKKDSTTINFKKKKFVIINKEKDWETSNSVVNVDEKFKNWRGIGVGFNSFYSGIGSFVLDKASDNMVLKVSKSTSFFLNPIQRNFHIYKNYINLVTGLGFQWNIYTFDKRVTLNPDSSYAYGRIDSLSTINYKGNALKTTFLNVPLLLEFNTNKDPKESLHIAFGVIGGLKLGSRTRQDYSLNANRITIVRKDNFNMNLLRLNAHASIGYKNVTFFTDYALTPLFEDGKGPEIYPFTFGLRLIPL